MGLRGVKTDEVYKIQQKPGKKSALPFKMRVLVFIVILIFHSIQIL